MEEKKNRLKKFYLELNDIRNKINNATLNVNIFDILKVSEVEIRHSNFLAWLLDAKQNHGLKDSFIRAFLLNFCNMHFEKLFNKNNSESFEESLFWELNSLDYYSFEVFREDKHIDLLLKSDKENIVIVIENKIYSSESEDQLKNYYDIALKDFVNYKKFFIYLTPDLKSAEKEEDQEHWLEFSYADIYLILKKIFELNEKTLSNESKIYIKNYLDILKENIMKENTELETICTEIYNKYSDVIDILIKNIPNEKIKMASKIKEMIKNKEWELKSSERSNVYIHFTTPELEKLFKNKGDGTWDIKDNNIVLFEIDNYDKNSLYFSCVVGPSEDKEFRDRILNFVKNDNNYIFNNKINNSEKFTTIYSVKTNYNDFESEWNKFVEHVKKIEEYFCKL